jgi:hypothetical protein
MLWWFNDYATSHMRVLKSNVQKVCLTNMNKIIAPRMIGVPMCGTWFEGFI